MLLVEEEGTASTLQALREVIGERGLSARSTPIAAAITCTPSKTQQTQVGRALSYLGIEHIAAYSPQARGRSERMFATLQGRLLKELRLAGIRTVEAANAWLKAHYLAEHNAAFAIKAEHSKAAHSLPPARGLARGAVRHRGANRRQRQYDCMERPAASLQN
jgi:hypothetical protein